MSHLCRRLLLAQEDAADLPPLALAEHAKSLEELQVLRLCPRQACKNPLVSVNNKVAARADDDITTLAGIPLLDAPWSPRLSTSSCSCTLGSAIRSGSVKAVMAQGVLLLIFAAAAHNRNRRATLAFGHDGRLAATWSCTMTDLFDHRCHRSRHPTMHLAVAPAAKTAGQRA